MDDLCPARKARGSIRVQVPVPSISFDVTAADGGIGHAGDDHDAQHNRRSSDQGCTCEYRQ